jgi:hypothetical protein
LFLIDAAQFHNTITVCALTQDSDVEWLRQLELEIASQDAIEKTQLRNEAGRVSTLLGHVERAREHFEASILENSAHSTGVDNSQDAIAEHRHHQRASYIGLRLLAMRVDDVVETLRLLSLETALCTAHSKAVLMRHQIDLFMACGDYDRARALLVPALAFAALHDEAAEVHLQLARLELAVCEDHRSEVVATLQELASNCADLQLPATYELMHGAMALLPSSTFERARSPAFAGSLDDGPWPLAPAKSVTSFGAILAARRAAHRGDAAEVAQRYASVASELTHGATTSGPPTTEFIDAVALRAWQWGAPTLTGPAPSVRSFAPYQGPAPKHPLGGRRR